MPVATSAFLSLLLILLSPALGLASTTQCPRYSVIVDGEGHLPANSNFKYRSTIELHKVGKAAGYDGTWRVVSWKMVNSYPHRVDRLPVGPLTVTRKAKLGKQSMDCQAKTAGYKMTNICTGGDFTLQMKNGKFISIKPGYSIGHVKGNTMTIRFDKKNPVEPEQVGTINEFKGKNLSLSITTPTQNGKFVYSNAKPGIITIDLKAQATPSNSTKDIKWSIPDIPGSKKTITPASGTGGQVQVSYEGLPTKNSSFGKKTVTAQLDAGPCKAKESRAISIFYPRDEKNHPGIEPTPNWFYYWSQTKARKGPVTYSGKSGHCAKGGNSERLMGYYRSQIFDDKYYMCDLANFGPSFDFQSVDWSGAKPNNRQVSGIDTFAVVSRHENAHYEHYTKWWKKYRTTDKFQDTNQNRIKDTAEQKFDKDKDLVPDKLEPSYSLDPRKKESLGAGVNDEELMCWKAEASWSVGSANKADWAVPGKQWTSSSP